MMALLLPFCAVLLSACGSPQATKSKSLYKSMPWPEKPATLSKQSQVAKYIVRGKSAYDSCDGNLKALGDLERPE